MVSKDKSKEELIEDLENLHFEYLALKSIFEMEKEAHSKFEFVLLEREKDLAITLQSIGDGVISTDKFGNISKLNPVAEKLCGWTFADAKGKNFSDIFRIINSETRQIVENPVKHVLESGKRFGLANHTILISKDGKEYQISDSAAPIKDVYDNILGVVVVFSDVTESYFLNKALRESESNLVKAELLGKFGNWDLDLTTKIITASKGASAIYGLDNDCWSYENVKSIPLQEYRKLLDDALYYLIAENKPYDLEFKIKRFTDGEILDIHSTASYDSVNNKVFGIIQDITERKKAEIALQKSETLYQNLVETSQDLIWECDAEGKYTYLNPAWQDVLGFKLEEMIGKKFAEFQYPEIAERDKKEFNRLVKGNSVKGFETVHISKSGKEINLVFNAKYLTNDNGDIIGTLGTAYDITERKKAEVALRKSEEKHRMIIDLAPDAFFHGDNNGNFIDVNDAALVITGYNKEELLNMNMKDLFSNNYLKNKPLRYELLELGETIITEREIIRKDGSTIFVEMNSKKMPDGTYQSFFRDITERNLTEKALQQSEERFKKLFHDSNIPMALLNEQYHFMEVNNKFSQIMEYSETDLQLMSFKDITHPAHVEQDENQIDRLIKNEINIYRTEKRYITKSNKVIWGDLQVSIIRNHSGDFLFLLANIIDITERKQSEIIQRIQYNIADAVVTSSNFNQLFEIVSIELSKLIDASNFYIAFYDKKTDMLFTPFEIGKKDNITKWQADKSLTGLVINQKKSLLLTKDQIYQLAEVGKIELIGLMAESWLGVPMEIEGRILGAIVVQSYENKYAYNNTSIEILELIANQLTIYIDRKRTEVSLKESEVKFRSLVESAFDGIYLLKKRNYIYVNPRFTEITGYSEEELLSDKFDVNVLMTNQSIQFMENRYESRLAGIDIQNQYEMEIITKSNNIVEIEVSTVVIEPEPDLLVLGIMRDIGKRKQIEKELIFAKNQAEESDRLKTAFLQNMSHEIRTPLNGIIGFSSLIAGEDISKEEIVEYTGIIKQSGNRLLEIVNNILDISKIETGQIIINNKTFCLNELINDLYQFFLPAANAKNLTLNFETILNDEHCMLNTDESKLNQILINLINNAIKFTINGNIIFGYKINNNSLIFYVRDSGIGIPENQQKRIFERFMQADVSISRNFDGAGLGLAICKGLIEFMGGKIWLESEFKKGTTFYFSLPVSFIENSNNRKNPESISTINSTQNTILIVEDDFISFKYLNRLLKNFKFVILKADNGLQAIDIVKNTTSIDLILMDIKMPIMDGIEAAKIIKKIRPEIPIIAQTAYAFSQERNKVLSEGFDDYISKPIEKNELLKLATKYLKSK